MPESFVVFHTAPDTLLLGYRPDLTEGLCESRVADSCPVWGARMS